MNETVSSFDEILTLSLNILYDIEILIEFFIYFINTYLIRKFV